MSHYHCMEYPHNSFCVDNNLHKNFYLDIHICNFLDQVYRWKAVCKCYDNKNLLENIFHNYLQNTGRHKYSCILHNFLYINLRFDMAEMNSGHFGKIARVVEVNNDIRFDQNSRCTKHLNSGKDCNSNKNLKKILD